MVNIDTTYLKRCISALDRAYHLLENYSEDEIEYEIYRSALAEVIDNHAT